MKLQKSFLLSTAALFAVGVVQTSSAQTLLTFDEFLPGTSYSTVPNGYGGLQWVGFGVISGTQYYNTAYYTGMVSPNNVAFNDDEYDRRAYLSSSTPFNLESAYLTSGIYAPMQVEVEGFTGNNLIYNNTYLLSANAPTLVNFDYVGVTSVEFLPQVPGSTYVSDAYIFAMDNLTISVVPEPSTVVLFAAGAALVGLRSLARKSNRSHRNHMAGS